MSSQIDYQTLLQEIVRTANKAALSAQDRKDESMLFAYYDTEVSQFFSPQPL